MSKDFKQGVLVWAKMKGFPPWPARIAFPADGQKPKSKKPQHYVFFFGTNDFAWILDQHIVPHSEEMLANAKRYKKKSTTMQAAIQEIERAGQKGVKKSLTKVKKEPAVTPPPLPEMIPGPSSAKTPKKKIKVEKKSPKKRSASAMSSDLDEDYSLLIANVPPNNGYPNVAVIPPYNDDSKPNFTSRFLNGPLLQSAVAPSNVSIVPTKNIKNAIFLPTSKKIGFLGLGEMGRELVKRLLSTGHNVTIWNRSPLNNLAEFVEAGAKTGQFPADVIQACDITFCCVSGPEASKDVVFGNSGVLEGFNGPCSNKAYIEMSSIYPVTSRTIAEAIAGKGGRYLEAPMVGKRQDVITSSLVILAAGDRELFADCNTVFASWAKDVRYLGSEIGSANIMRLYIIMVTFSLYLCSTFTLLVKCTTSF